VTEQDEDIRAIVRAHSEYEFAAYHFVGDALGHAVQLVEEQNEELGVESANRHVTPVQLLDAVRELAWDRFGLLASVVFQQWGIHETLDIGKIVFHMIDAKLMSKQDGDRLEDFEDVFDLTTAFDRELDLEIVDD
jgi:uncharacterized repeat protein (TIGR04138 family)